ncbi:MAG: C45 family autoproteolytic acyltransferase/hydrolase [Anaerolineae bacterium]
MTALVNSIEQFEVAGSHFEVGLAIGRRFAEQIRRMLDSYSFFQEQVLPYHHTPEGQARYRELLEVNRARYPDYIAELEGLAQGVQRPFEDLFLVNMRGEYSGYLYGLGRRGCSDCAVVTDEVALMGHNEDGSPVFRGNLYLVHVKVEDKPAFTALSYPGFLCGNAFGFNAEGVCFSVDSVGPRDVRVGVGRHFIAHSLLEARSLEDAIERVIVPGRASGFSYTIGSISERRVVLVEVAPGAHHVREVRGAYFHTNHYLELTDVDQVVGPSSQARLERANVFIQDNPSLDAAGVLTILGDRADEQYPVYRTATPPDGGATLCTALFDLDARQLRIFTAHPTEDPEECIALAM